VAADASAPTAGDPTVGRVKTGIATPDKVVRDAVAVRFRTHPCV